MEIFMMMMIIIMANGSTNARTTTTNGQVNVAITRSFRTPANVIGHTTGVRTKGLVNCQFSNRMNSAYLGNVYCNISERARAQNQRLEI